MSEGYLLSAIHIVVLTIEVAGIGVIFVGVVWALIRAVREGFSHGPDAVHIVRAELGRAILLGLELLVAADIINTVAIEPSLDSLAVLAGVVAIRTFLSFSLEVEIEGTWPWRKGEHGSKSGQPE